jgi:hypothetical protein
VRQAVKARRGGDLERGFTRTFGARAIDYVVAFAPFGDHLVHDLGRTLEVGIDQHDSVAAGGIDAARDGDLVAEIAREAD